MASIRQKCRIRHIIWNNGALNTITINATNGALQCALVIDAIVGRASGSSPCLDKRWSTPLGIHGQKRVTSIFRCRNPPFFICEKIVNETFFMRARILPIWRLVYWLSLDLNALLIRVRSYHKSHSHIWLSISK